MWRGREIALSEGLAVWVSKAEKQDAERIAALVNSAYRGESSKQGWTTEADLLDGRRTDTDEILQLISSGHSMFLVCKAQTELVGVVNLEKQEGQVCLGMLAVNPQLQGNGIGKRLLLEAEQAAQDSWGLSKLVMSVISCREELIAFYGRCGYHRTGISKDFPANPDLWTPKIRGLQLEILEKAL